MHRDKPEEVNFQCSKLGKLARFTFTTRYFYANESDSPIAESLIRQDCSGRLDCGITPKLSPTSWEITDWSQCECPKSNSEDKT